MDWVRNTIGAASAAIRESARAITDTINEAVDDDAADAQHMTFSDDLVEFANSLTEETFLSYPKPPSRGPLSETEVRHAKAILARAPRVSDIRFALCPAKMSDERFWNVYFQLVAKLWDEEKDGMNNIVTGILDDADFEEDFTKNTSHMSKDSPSDSEEEGYEIARRLT